MRHLVMIDDEPDPDAPHWPTEEVAVCSHCGAEWTTQSLLYNDGCCPRDQQLQDMRECQEVTQ